MVAAHSPPSSHNAFIYRALVSTVQQPQPSGAFQGSSELGGLAQAIAWHAVSYYQATLWSAAQNKLREERKVGQGGSGAVDGPNDAAHRQGTQSCQGLIFFLDDCLPLKFVIYHWIG